MKNFIKKKVKDKTLVLTNREVNLSNLQVDMVREKGDKEVIREWTEINRVLKRGLLGNLRIRFLL